MCESNQLLSTDECKLVLKKYCGDKAWKLIAFNIKSFSDNLEGMLGEHYRLTIQYQNESNANSTNFFLKVVNGESKTIFDIVKTLNAYNKEVFYYNVLLEEYAKEQIDISFAPIIYLSENYKLVIEDLTAKNFAKSNLDDFDLDHCEAALKTLAKFHASGIIYEYKKNIKLTEKFPVEMEDALDSQEENDITKWMTYTLNGLISIIKLLNLTQENKLEFIKNIKSLCENSSGILKSNKAITSVLHGDLWSSNLLFKYKNNKPIECAIIDYQLIKYGSVAIDVVHLIMANTRKEFRKRYYYDLLEYYYRELKNYLSHNGVNLNQFMGGEDFMGACDDVLCSVKLFVIKDRSITLSFDEAAIQALTSEESLRNFLFEDREKIMTSMFVNNEVYKQVLQEDLLELMELLNERL